MSTCSLVHVLSLGHGSVEMVMAEKDSSQDQPLASETTELWLKNAE